MTTKPKVYMLPNADGINSMMVVAANQKEACRFIGTSVGGFRDYGGHRLAEDHPAYAIALSEPDMVWKRKIDYGNTPQAWLFAKKKERG